MIGFGFAKLKWVLGGFFFPDQGEGGFNPPTPFTLFGPRGASRARGRRACADHF